jgi:hypothetical protein
MQQAPLVGLVASQEQANDICPSTFLGLIDLHEDFWPYRFCTGQIHAYYLNCLHMIRRLWFIRCNIVQLVKY